MLVNVTTEDVVWLEDALTVAAEAKPDHAHFYVALLKNLLPQVPDETTVPCPHCHAAIGEVCRSSGGAVAWHSARDKVRDALFDQRES